ncbi:glutathione S-transferase protein [Hyaloraphidium curvatum]|nr:glutathione S-transferase protein [Hyaloraphidium curvatum]
MGTYKLFWAPDTGALPVQLALEKLGAKYEKIVVDTNAMPPELAKVNPMRQVPVLILPDGHKMTESAAMILQLADNHPEAELIPAPGLPGRADAYRWLAFMAANCYETVLRSYYKERYTNLQTEESLAGVKDAAAERILRLWKVVEDEAFQGGPWILGARESPLDGYLWVLTNWLPNGEAVLAACPKIAKMCEAVKASPEVKKVWAENYPDKPY